MNILRNIFSRRRSDQPVDVARYSQSVPEPVSATSTNDPALNVTAEAIIRFLAANRVRNGFDAARRWRPDVSDIPGIGVQDPRVDVTSMDRLELVRKSQYFEKNDAVANRLGEVFVEFTVGPNGPLLTPSSSDDEWNQRMSDWIAEWYPLADISTRLGYGNLMATAAWRRFFDGEFFILKTRGKDKTRPRLQGIPAHRVSTPPDLYDQEGKTIVDGVRIDERGRPVGYYIRETIEGDTWTFRTSNEVIHLFEPESPGQYRGWPMLAPVLDDLHRFSDLFLMEARAAAVQAKDAVFLKTDSGEIPLRAASGGGQFLLGKNQNLTQKNQQQEPTDTAQRAMELARAFGGRVFTGKLGEELQYLASNRPSVTTQWFFDYYASRICAGVGISKLLVFPWSIQGTVARADLDMARNYFLSRFAPFSAVAQQIYWFVAGVARFTDVRVADAPADWTRVTVRPPRAVNVDVGRNSAATISELERGLTTYEEQFAMRGLDWRQQLRQWMAEKAFIKQVAAQYGVDENEAAEVIQKRLATA